MILRADKITRQYFRKTTDANVFLALQETDLTLVPGTLTEITGRSGSGKSTLLNALVGDDRAIVSDIKGTTRDTIEDTVTIDGQLFRIIDTAGLRHTNDTIEKMGIERSMKAAKNTQQEH